MFPFRPIVRPLWGGAGGVSAAIICSVVSTESDSIVKVMSGADTVIVSAHDG
ncbi:hypothetical protein MARPU_03395 [Marichromatium purpuratum 984]|uniref:Uncharacterized protein n=1 Tax=Marichromatium purpuratum 984 TaxID=765910 RepID=W0E819_MARPU|nr:hypothetical protein MARPU_03395 [Marichromatium purpuratum 984]